MPTGLTQNSFKTLLDQSLGNTFSPVIIQIIQATLQEDVDFEKVAKLVSLDAVLAAMVIGIANSPSYGYGRTVNSVKDAVTILGLKEILRLAINISIKKNLNSELNKKSDVTTHDWVMTIWSAVAAEHLALHLGHPQKEHAYLAAILKDIPLILMNGIASIRKQQKNSLIAFEQSQMQAEIDTWGLTHPEMSQILADAWNLSEELSDAMRLHHTPAADISKDKLLALAVALGTRWSELIQSATTTPEEIFNFELILRSSLTLQQDSNALEEIRLGILKDFKEVLVQLDIAETPLDQRLYENSLNSLKSYYFLSLDLADTAQDLPSLAQALGKHLSMFWLVQNWDIALKLPHNNNYLFFSFDKGAVSQSGPLPLEDWTKKSHTKKSFRFTIAGKYFGELLVPKDMFLGEKLQAFTAYLYFINQSLENYYNKRLKSITHSIMLNDLPISVARLDITGELIDANKEFINFFELDNLDDVSSIPKLIDKKFNLDFYDRWTNIIKKSGSGQVGELLSLPSSSNQATLYMITIRQCDSGSVPQILMLIQSVSEISSLEAQALKQRDFLQQLFTSMKDIVLTINIEGEITWTSPSLSCMEGKNFFAISRPTNPNLDWNPELLNEQKNILSPLEVGLKIEDNRFGLFEFIISPLGDKVSAFLVVGRDLTSIRRLEAKVRQQAISDELTGLYNRSYFYTLIKEKIDKQKENQLDTGLLFMDLDGFKGINDIEGHIAGDNFLKQVAIILQSSLRKGYDSAARYGGDEFAIIASKITPELLEKIAQRLIDQVNAQSKGRVGLSVGIAMIKPGQKDSIELLQRADQALYIAKAGGGNHFSWGDK